MKKLTYMMLVITMISACSDHTQTTVNHTLPKYDMISSCRKTSSYFKKHDTNKNHSYSDSMFNICLEREKADYEWLRTNWDSLSSKARIFCKRALSDHREDYSNLKVCAQAITCEEDNNNLTICVGQKN